MSSARQDPATLVCVPGLGLGEAAWLPALQALAARNLPDAGGIVLALPGFGMRPRRNDDLRPEALAERLLTWLPDAPGQPVVLAGHSASCQVVAHAARLAPDRVRGLVLVGPTTDPRARSWRRLAGRWLRTAAYERPDQVPTLLRTYARTGLRWMARTMDAARGDDVLATLESAGCPVVVVRGRHDRICPADWAGTVAAAGGPGSRIVTLPRGAHMVPLTHGEDVGALLARVLT